MQLTLSLSGANREVSRLFVNYLECACKTNIIVTFSGVVTHSIRAKMKNLSLVSISLYLSYLSCLSYEKNS